MKLKTGNAKYGNDFVVRVRRLSPSLWFWWRPIFFFVKEIDLDDFTYKRVCQKIYECVPPHKNTHLRKGVKT